MPYCVFILVGDNPALLLFMMKRAVNRFAWDYFGTGCVPPDASHVQALPFSFVRRTELVQQAVFD